VSAADLLFAGRSLSGCSLQRKYSRYSRIALIEGHEQPDVPDYVAGLSVGDSGQLSNCGVPLIKALSFQA